MYISENEMGGFFLMVSSTKKCLTKQYFYFGVTKKIPISVAH